MTPEEYLKAIDLWSVGRSLAAMTGVKQVFP
jgi:hypothetical protein